MEAVPKCIRGVAWLYQAYPQPLIISGHSAGGHLTGEMFATPWANYDLPSDTHFGSIVHFESLNDTTEMLFYSLRSA